MTELERVLGPVVSAFGGAPPVWVEQFERYAEMLRARNERVNLISRRAIDRLVEGQLLPSLAALGVVPPGSSLRVLDIGTGGGLPGIPLKILRPSIQLGLLDATRKKTEFVADVVAELGLEETIVHWGRLESPPETLVAQAPFDLALARAVGNESRVVRAMGALSPGAPVWVFDDPDRGEHVVDHPDLGRITALRRAVR